MSQGSQCHNVRFTRLIESVSSYTRNCGRDASVCLGSGLLETVEGLLRVSELTLSMSLVNLAQDLIDICWRCWWIIHIWGSAFDDWRQPCVRQTKKIDAGKKFPLFLLWFTPPVFCFGCTTTGQLTWLVAIFFLHLAGGVRFRVKKLYII